jgi:flagellar basal-body rod protein FlgG
MIRSLYTAATGMSAQELRLDVISNNLANTSTTGFKRVRADFEDLLSETLKGANAPDPRGGVAPAPLQVGLGVQTSGTSRSFAPGEMTQTNNPLDLAIQGNGFFRVQQVNGDFGYTRAGNLRIDATGRVVTQHGEILDPQITVPPNTTQITIQPDGTVFATVSGNATPTQLGVIQLCTFPNPGGLLALGNNLFGQTQASGEALLAHPGQQGTGTLNQGYLEGSNVNTAQEMIDMISAQHGWELNSKVIQTADQMLAKLTSLR